MAKEKEGSITVFLSLILLLILAVIMTTIEAARNNGARVNTTCRCSRIITCLVWMAATGRIIWIWTPFQ